MSILKSVLNMRNISKNVLGTVENVQVFIRVDVVYLLLR